MENTESVDEHTIPVAQQLQSVGIEVDQIEKKIEGIEADKMMMEESLDHLRRDPDGKKKIVRLQHRLNWETEELMKNLIRLDQIIAGEKSRPLRKALVVKAQDLMSKLDTLSTELLAIHDSIPEGIVPDREDTEIVSEQTLGSQTNMVEASDKKDEVMKDIEDHKTAREDTNATQMDTSPPTTSPTSPPSPSSRTMNRPRKSWLPQMDVSENRTKYIVKVTLPGVKKSDITLDVDKEKRMLEFSAPVPPQYRETARQDHFKKSYKVPPDVDILGIEAQVTADGILEIYLPRVLNRKGRAGNWWWW